MPSKHTALTAVLVASVAGQATSAHMGSVPMSYFAAAAFVLAGLQYGFLVNRAWWTPDVEGIGPTAASLRPAMSARTADLIGLGYVWGGASLLAVYLLSGLKWQHGWQYGLGMVLIGAALMAWSRWLRSAVCSAGQFKARLAVMAFHGLAAACGVLWLLTSGKAQSLKGDWAANVVFLLGGLFVVGVTAMAMKAALRLQAHATDARRDTAVS